MTEKDCKTIELDKVLQKLQEYAVCDDTKDAAVLLRPLSNQDEVKQMLQETNIITSLLQKYASPRYSNVIGVTEMMNRAVKGGVLSPGELLRVASAFRNFRYLKTWFFSTESTESELEYKFQQLSDNISLENSIFDAILSETEIADTASAELFDIRKKIKNTESSIRDKLDNMIRSQNYQKFLQESVITLRNNKFVVPVKAEFKNEVNGVVHDVSATGSTLFIEPASVVEANAKIMQLRNNEQDEMNRILAQLTDLVAENAHFFNVSYKAMLEIDMLLAKGKLALSMSAFCPTVEDNFCFSLKQAKHPLLPKEKAVAIDVSLGYDYDTLIITGPNTGGKTVTLKTAGLLCAMACCGLLIPASEHSSVCVFDDILVDIGDEQSIEQSLSTFSGHMKNITEILKKANAKTLVLMDELGAGTDPAEGAALALSIIETLRKKGSKIMATTHYAELKIFALDTIGVQNASCEFDIQTLRPTYKLIVGVPGRSNAFLISEKLGVPEEVIELAKNNLSAENRQFEDVLIQLDHLKRELTEKEIEVAELRNAAGTVLEKAEKERQALVKQGEMELATARAKAKQLADNVQNEAYRLLDEMKALQKKESMAAQQKAHLARKIARGEAENLYRAISDGTDTENTNYPPLSSVKKGDKVVLNKTGIQGTVTTLPDANGYVEVLTGAIKTKVLLEDLHAATTFEKPTKKRTVSKRNGDAPAKEKRSASFEINVIGQNVEEALMEVDMFIDNAVLSNQNTIYIIHGKGTGTLRKGIHQHLKKHKNVASFRLGTFGEGEDGVTVVTLK